MGRAPSTMLALAYPATVCRWSFLLSLFGLASALIWDKMAAGGTLNCRVVDAIRIRRTHQASKIPVGHNVLKFEGPLCEQQCFHLARKK